jgi:hypothetical protein
VLAVIGREWLTTTNEQGARRLDDPRDTVRTELQAALERDIRIIPLLVGGTSMPSPDALPSSLQDLSYRNALPLRPDPDFRRDIDVLVRSLRDPNPASAPRDRFWVRAATGLLATIVAIAILAWISREPPPRYIARKAPVPESTPEQKPPEPDTPPPAVPANLEEPKRVVAVEPPAEAPIAAPLPIAAPQQVEQPKSSAPPPPPKQYTIELTRLVCEKPNDSDGEDEVTLTLRADGKPVFVKHSQSFNGTPCVRLKKGQAWNLGVQLTFQQEAVIELDEIEGLLAPRPTRITPATLEQGLNSTRIEGSGVVRERYTLEWKVIEER